ncbi:Hsp20 family protein [Thiorhodovibrio frisius]|uniref:Molecular chaperone (Small heat shock protein) n=1 Tax=Thiorhodovibrio frisius TaxID=631362 RepID=H8Z0L8_9GAMM|nr:Hsp20 family protein [Thiorhodovibrio frisius]EIC22359.1 molecular chaperone (small heat shock protein) [Thiorhodovibrio frisius]WPL24658.1 16 kDa heat shock protein A [Thiorhodovibrio frisius]
MTTLDFSPLFRSMIGFDRLASSLENAYRSEPGGYPPYNVELESENNYRISLAVAGFSEDELGLEVKENVLSVTGQRREETKDRQFLYRGIANRSFERKFQLADYVKVVDARLENGLLHIDLEREVPEAMKPRKIEIRRDQASPRGFIESEHAKAA